jgi:TonB family protein
MRRRLFNCALLICLAAASAAAQRPYTQVWLRVMPEGEEFAVHFPEPNFRIRRELPFGGGVTLRPASFEVTRRGALLSVLSFAKSEAGALKSLDEFVKGFRHALGESAAGKSAVVDSVQGIKLDGRDGRQFSLNVGDDSGSARVFETDRHFYVVFAYGGKAGAALIEHFNNSFTFDQNGADRVPLSETGDASEFWGQPVKSPEPLWPVAGGSALAIGTRDTTPTDYTRLPVIKPGERKIVSGGILNGKALAKPMPVYPPIAKAARAQGTVTIQILVDEEGYVISANAVSGHPLLQQSASFAARQARFTPTTLEGQPVKVSGVITYNYVLQ